MRYSHSFSFFVILVSVFSFAIGCSKSTLSARDQRLEQIRNNAEKKRKELAQVAKSYIGNFYQSGSSKQNVLMRLEIKEIPYQEEGQVDPIMVPELTGHLRFVFGGSETEGEYINFGVKKAEYDAKDKTLNVVFYSEQYKNLITDFGLSEGTLEGSWVAPDFGGSGTATLGVQGTSGPISSDKLEALNGTYLGKLVNSHPQSNLPETTQIGLVTNQDPALPGGFVITGKVRFYSDDSLTEWDELDFGDVSYNLFSGKIVAKTAGNLKLTFSLTLADSKMSGVLFAGALGEVATWEGKKQ